MTSLFQARRSAEEFAAAVDGDTNGRARRNEELSGLLGIVQTLRDQAPVEPRAEFSRDLRSRLMLEAETVLRPEATELTLPARQRGRRERRLVAAASAFLLVGGTTTMAAAAQSALPGEALYPIKRGIERAEAGLSISAEGKGRDLLAQASGRLVEVEGLLAADAVQSEPAVPETLEDFSTSARAGASLLFEAFRETGDPGAVVQVRTFSAEGIDTLEALAESAPPAAQDELTAAALLLHDIDREASALCGSCASELPVVEVPGIFLARAEVDRALFLAARHDLDNDHPVVVPRGMVEAASDTSEAGPTASAEPEGGAAAPVPSPTWGPTAWPSLLPDLGTGSSTDTKSDGSSLAETTDQLSETLSDAVETLLPDADDPLS